MAEDSMQICRYAEEPGNFLDLLARSGCPFADGHSFPLSASYYAEYFGGAHNGDASFIAHQDGAALVVMRGQSVNGVLADNGQDVSLFVASSRTSEAVVLDLLKDAARRSGCHTIRILDHAASGVMTPLGRALMFHRAVPQPRVLAIADLTASEAELRGGLRKSYKSLINWGLKTLRFQNVTAQSFDPAAIESFRQFHIQTAGRETRSLRSWELQGEMIKANRAELLLSYLDGDKLVGASLFLDTGETTTYGVGVYERSLFEKPLSHAPIFMGMLRAKERGQRRFLIGDVPAAKSPQDKEFSIGWFKSGFTANLTLGLDWTYKLQEPEAAGLDTATAQHPAATVSER